MPQTMTVMLCDGFRVTFRRRSWAEAKDSILEHMDKIAALAESGKNEEQKALENLKLDLEFRERPMRLYVENWDEVKPLISQAGFNQLERDLQKFSLAELTEGN